MADYFDADVDSPYMLLVASVVEQRRCDHQADSDKLWGIERLNVVRSDIPAVTHIDYSARIQTVHRDTNQRYYDLLKTFEAKTGCGVLVNTSFNVRGEPIVNTPQDAYRCFMRTEIDTLVLENCVLTKAGQPPLTDDADWKSQFTLD
jgi:carbamoyltransferase